MRQRLNRVMQTVSAIFEVRHSDSEIQRKGRILAIMLLGIEAALLVLSVFNLVQGDMQYTFTNVFLISCVLGLYTLNRFGFVHPTSLFTVALTGVVPFLLIDDTLVGTYVAMVLPVLTASSLLAPWSGFVLAALMILGAFVNNIASLSLLLIGLIAIFSYLFANSIDRAYRDNLHRALHDGLTSLPNRSLFLERLQQSIDRLDRDGRLRAVLFMDLDQFKVVNDSLGHNVGDELLTEVAWRLPKYLRRGDIAARLGGDEFAILLDGIADVREAIQVAERISNTVQIPMKLKDQQIVVSTSVGIALCEDASDQPHVLLRNADVAMYEAKRSGRGNFMVFGADMHIQALRRLELENHLRQAIEWEELEIHYQPMVSLTTGKVTGMEALVRWEHPKHGLMSPQEFVPIAEETGLIVPLGRWVLKEASRRASQWIKDDPSNSSMILSVNISMKQFKDPQLVEDLGSLFQEANLKASNLQLEVTESIVADDLEHTNGLLQELKRTGVKLAIDDFGTGYSSLATLGCFPLDTLKIDKRFVSEMEEDAQNQAIVQLIIDLAHLLKMQAIAEGVETAQQLVMLTNMGCDQAQGFYFSEALTNIETAALLADSTRSLR